MAKTLSLSGLLNSGKFPKGPGRDEEKKRLEELQLKLLRIQQSVWKRKERVIIVFEGFDAAGKGGAIRRLVQQLDPRGVRVHPIGPPSEDEKSHHYLYRFWRDLPPAGMIAIFDRSWYGRVLVERVEGLAPEKRIREAYAEIREFERQLTDDGIHLIKIFLAIDKQEQLKRFEDRLADPYKQWKLSKEDIGARAKWKSYVAATDDLLRKTEAPAAPWNLIAANDKHYARLVALDCVVRKLKSIGDWMESAARKHEKKTLKTALRELGLGKKALR